MVQNNIEKSEDLESRLKKAKESSSVNTLLKLSKDEATEVRCEVANSLKTPRYILEKLSIDEVKALYNEYVNPKQTKIFSNFP